MIEKLICAVIIAALWLCAFGTLSGAVDAAKEAVNTYRSRVIEQERESKEGETK